MTELRKLYLYDPDTGGAAKFDSITNALTVIDYEHHEHHGGSAYAVQVVTTSGTAVSLAFKTPAGTKKAHMVFEFATESKAHVIVYEGTVWTTNTGTVVAPKQQNRSSANTSMLLEDKTATPAYTAGGVLQNPTITTVGDVISQIYTFAGKQTGSSGGKRHELILDPDETYSFVLTSDDGSKGLQLRLYWYEHTDAN
jgi:hypothetical protein